MKRRRLTFAAPLIALAACASVPPAGEPLIGQWGGVHVGLTLSATGGTMDYDCAAGTIGAIVPRRDGSFEALGTHTPGHGGPDRIGEVPTSYPARYSGSVRGDLINLQGRYDNGVLLGPFKLRRGAEPQILRCL